MVTRSKDIGTRAEAAVVRYCEQCGYPRPKGRTHYCSDVCHQEAVRERETARQAGRRALCRMCQGPKGDGPRGGKYCAECRRLRADVVGQLEHERTRRKVLAKRAEMVGAGERVASVRVGAPEGMKWCARCQEFRPVGSFPPRKDNGKQAAYCRPCQRSYNRERRMKITFGVEWDDYERMLACQEGRCAICRRLPRKFALAIDHDHSTGEIRGLLCYRCNHKLLGSADDDPAILRRAADYLESFTARDVFGEPRYMPGVTPTDREEAQP